MNTRVKWVGVIAMWLAGAAIVLWIDHRDDQNAERAANAAAAQSPAVSSATTAIPERPEVLKPEIVRTLDHDATMYTEGLEIQDGTVFESGGRYGQSSVRTSDEATGDVLAKASLPAASFGEGLTLGPDGLVQLTWKEGVARVYSPNTLTETGTLSYKGEGWGLCWDGTHYVMSNGSDALTFRNPKTFATASTLKVTSDGLPVAMLNELECADGVIWANVYQTDRILRIDPSTGQVTGIVDASSLVAKDNGERPDVLNGIASVGNGKFWVTGKWWTHTYEVRFVPSA